MHLDVLPASKQAKSPSNLLCGFLCLANKYLFRFFRLPLTYCYSYFRSKVVCSTVAETLSKVFMYFYFEGFTYTLYSGLL